MTKHATQEEVMIALFAEEPSLAVTTVNEQLANDEAGEALLTLQYLAKATSDMTSLADTTALNRTQLYKTLSSDGNPHLNTLTKVLAALNMRLSIQPIQQH